MSNLADIIRTIPIFSGLAREDVAKILGKLEEKNFAAGATVFSQGEKGDSFYIIQSGAVQVVLNTAGGRSEVISVLGPQDCFGEMALLSGDPRSATIVAVKDATVWRLSREDWDELIEKHPTWLLHFCATLSRRLTHAEKQYSQGRDAFNTLAEEFYSSRPSEEQEFLRHLSLLTTVDPKNVNVLLQTEKAEGFLNNLVKSQLPLIRTLDGKGYELHGFFRDFLVEKLVAVEGKETRRQLHTRLAEICHSLNIWDHATHHFIEAQDWAGATRILSDHKEELLNGFASFLKSALERISQDYFFSDLRLVHIKAETLAHLGDFAGAVRTYKEVLARKAAGTESVVRYQNMADILVEKKDYVQALNCLRSALTLMEQETATLAGDVTELYWDRGKPAKAWQLSKAISGEASLWSRLLSLCSRFCRIDSPGRWIGGALGLSVWGYLWFWQPDIGLGPDALKLVALLSATLIFWIFWVFPEHGTALFFALALILTGLGSGETVLGGYASTTWFMSLGVLALGAAITGSGLFYRLSLQLVRFFPLTYHWQTLALGFMGVVIAALIPQKSARATIISPMILNLSESLGYKDHSKATTGLFAATFLGLGQLNFLYLTGSTATLLAWGLLPADVRAQFTWGYWFIATLPPTLVVIATVLLGVNLLYRPESQSRVSYRMVQNQIQILGPLSREEWITLVVLCFTVAGWLTFSYHKIHAAWISLIGLTVLINTGVLGWGMFKKGIDWEFLIYLGATLSIPSLLTKAKIDEWLSSFLAPFVLPFVDQPAIAFIIIALIGYALKLVFTSRLVVITLVVALSSLSSDMGISPWVMTVIILMGAEVWFFRFQVDWHTMAYATTDGKAFTYPLMCRINPVYALAYILGLIAGIPYWRYLGLIG